MKNRVIVFLTAAGLACPALAQTFTYSLVPSAATVDTSGGDATFTLMLVADADVGTHLMGGGIGGLLSDGASDAVTSMSWNVEGWSSFNSDGGYAGSGNYNSVFFGWLYLGCPVCEPPADAELSAVVGSFEVTVAADSVGQLDFSMFTAQDTNFSMQTMDFIDSGGQGSYEDTMGTLVLQGASVNLVPAPGTSVLFGSFGMLAMRRRRSFNFCVRVM